jgi:hypothetical protein
MAVGFPTKVNYATGDVLSATNMNDLSGTVNLLQPMYENQYAAGKNPVLNSNFSVWQRGTSTAITGSATNYVTDRFYAYRGGFVTGGTISRQATGDTTNLAFIQYCARVLRDSGNTSTQPIAFVSDFETVNSVAFAGKTVTFSFYARKGALYSATSSLLNVQLYSGTGTDQRIATGYTGSTTPINQNATLTTTWQRFTYTAAIPSNSTQLGMYFLSTPTGTAGATDYYEITGIQLEASSVASSYAPNGSTYQAELAACQRYYWRNTAPASGIAFTTFGACFSTTVMRTYLPFPTVMRTSPTAVEYSGLQTYDLNAFQTITTLDFNNANTAGALISGNVASGLTQFRPALIYATTINTSYIGFSAEL